LLALGPGHGTLPPRPMRSPGAEFSQRLYITDVRTKGKFAENWLLRFSEFENIRRPACGVDNGFHCKTPASEKHSVQLIICKCAKSLEPVTSPTITLLWTSIMGRLRLP
jgi:hypothetical protein